MERRRVEDNGEQKQQQKKEHNIMKVSDYIISYNFDIEIYMLSICLSNHFAPSLVFVYLNISK